MITDVAVGTVLSEVMARAKRPWLALITQFAGNTTMHGIRFLVEGFIMRRFALDQPFDAHCCHGYM